MGGAAVVFGAGLGPAVAGEITGPVSHVLVGAAVLMVVLATPLRRWVLGSMGGGATALTLVANRPATPARVWLTAHSDSKGQYFSMAARIGLAGATAVSALSLLCLAGLSLAGRSPGGEGGGGAWWTVFGLVALLAGATLSLNGILRDSPGAVDNATGLLTVLATIDRLGPERPVGVIVPDAEEWGLVGAAALVRDHPDLFHGTSVVNFDGIDDRGACVVFEHRSGAISQAVARSLGVRPRRWLPVVVDGVAFNRAAGLDGCITVMRGDAGTMRVVHTARDEASRLSLTGVDLVAGAVAKALAS
jgi:hypothetical protein